jgi:hypothetical protein
MKPQARFAVIEAWLQACPLRASVDVLDAEFVWHYIEATAAKAGVQIVGAPKCPQLGRDLGAMFRAGRLRRGRVGMPVGYASAGFPTWVYCYELPALPVTDSPAVRAE